MKDKSKKVFDIFYSWNFGSINIRTGDEKSEGSKMYMVTKDVPERIYYFVHYKKFDTEILVMKLLV